MKHLTIVPDGQSSLSSYSVYWVLTTYLQELLSIGKNKAENNCGNLYRGLRRPLYYPLYYETNYFEYSYLFFRHACLPEVGNLYPLYYETNDFKYSFPNSDFK